MRGRWLWSPEKSAALHLHLEEDRPRPSPSPVNTRAGDSQRSKHTSGQEGSQRKSISSETLKRFLDL